MSDSIGPLVYQLAEWPAAGLQGSGGETFVATGHHSVTPSRSQVRRLTGELEAYLQALPDEREGSWKSK